VIHPLVLSAGGAVLPAYGIGAVATRPEARRRGHADRLCRHALAAAEAEGRGVGLLYSAIPPAYYERMGFAVAPAWEHTCGRPAELAASGPQAALTPLDPRREARVLAQLYEQHHGVAPHVHRDEAGFARSIALHQDDLYFGLGEPCAGYARVSLYESTLEVTELCVPEEERAPVLRALAQLAARLNRTRLVGWFAPCAELTPHLVDEGRAKTLPMLRGLPPAPLTHFWSSDYF
jgi:predicted acetyltransferase